MTDNKRIQQVIQHAYLHAPAIKALFDSVDVSPFEIRRPEDLAKLPVTSKESVPALQHEKPPLGGFLGVPLTEVARFFMSPGPIYDPQGKERDFWRWGPALRKAGFGPGDVVQNTFSYHFTPAGFMFDEGLRHIGAAVIPAGVGNNELQVRVMHHLRVTGFVGVPSYLMALIKKAEEMGYNFIKDFRLNKGFLTAEKLPDSLRRELHEIYGINVFQGYGTADLGCIAYECERKNGMHLDENGAIVEIVDPETGKPLLPGEVGEVVVTLLDETYPLVRLGTGDLSSYNDETCECGQATRRLMGLVGRVGDAVKVRGMFVHPSQVREVMVKFPEIACYQGVVTRDNHRDCLCFLIEVCGEIREGTLEGIAACLQELTRVKPTVQVVPAGTINPGSKQICDRRIWE